MPVEDEMKQIISWSKSNKLSINLAKCKVFWRPGLKSESMPSLLPDVVGVTCCKLLGRPIFVDCNLNFCQQVDQVVKVCSRRYYLLQQMHKQGLDAGCLQVVLQSIVISKVLYALPACYVSRENIRRIDKMLQKARRYDFTSTLHCFEELLEQADDKLFSGTVRSNQGWKKPRFFWNFFYRFLGFLVFLRFLKVF